MNMDQSHCVFERLVSYVSLSQVRYVDDGDKPAHEWQGRYSKNA